MERFIKIVAGGLNTHNAEQISYQLYNQASTTTTTYYRGQDISDEGIVKFIDAKEIGTVLHSASFMSVAKEKAIAELFIHGKKQVMFIIEGFSASNVISKLSVSGEKDSVFTPHADFKVTNIGYSSENKGRVTIKLTEVRGHSGKRSVMPY